MRATIGSGSRAILLDTHDLRPAGAAMLAIAAVRPLVHDPGIPCPLRTLTGIPCPLCGMTTSVTDVVHFQWRDALLANPAGFAAVAVAVWLLARRDVERVALPTWFVGVGLAAMWVFELFRFSVI